jgi:4-hydroxy-2-oxoheptanedioate aldolase
VAVAPRRMEEEAPVPNRINRAIELLAEDQAIYYTGHHSGHVLTEAAGREDANTWADYINVGMEHGAFDMAGLEAYMRGLAAGGPTRSGHRTPAVVVEAPVNGTDAANVWHNAWQFRQILGRGVQGILLCQAEDPEAVRAFVESCRYPHQEAGVDPALPSPVARMHGALTRQPGPGLLGPGTRGRGSERSAAPAWGIPEAEYMRRCDPWPLNPEGELLLGVKLESPEGIARCEEILAVPGLGFAEMGPGDLGLSLLGHVALQPWPYPPEMREARGKVFAACRARRIAFLEGCSPESVAARIDEGVRVIAGGREDTAQAGRAHQRRAMAV